MVSSYHRLTIAWNVSNTNDIGFAVYLDKSLQVSSVGDVVDSPGVALTSDATLIVGDPTDSGTDHSPAAVLDEFHIFAGFGTPGP